MKNGKDNTFDMIEGFGNVVTYFTVPIILKWMDVLTTAKFIQLGVKEGNPFIAWLMSIDMNLAYAVSFFGGLSVFAFLYFLKYRVSNNNSINTVMPYLTTAFKITYCVLIALSMYVVIHNLIIISYSDTRILI